jgi:glutamate--cysteine ligase catalytic subunit
MGLLSLGTPLAWKDAKQFADHVRSHGITQFLHMWDRVKDRCGDELFWGDEVLGHGIDRFGGMLTVS